MTIAFVTPPPLISRYPFAREYLAWVRHCRAITAAGGRVVVYWYAPEGVDAAGWREEFRAALDRRITAKAGSPTRGRYTNGLRGVAPCFVRDQQRLADRRRRIVISGFESPAVKKRFAHLLAGPGV